MTENEYMMQKDKILRTIAEVLGQDEPPCNKCRFMDYLADYCPYEMYCSDLCSPDECWLKVLEKLIENKGV